MHDNRAGDGNVGATAVTNFTVAGAIKADTLAEADPMQRLLVALENMATADPPRLFAHKYALLNERAMGGQAVVNFARKSTGGMEQYAVKFFNVRKDYDLELELYQDEALRKVLPAIFHASDNSDGSAKSISGFEFPPFLVLERGITFGAWAEQRRRYSEVLTMFEQIAELLHVLHASGRVHRDLKPANALYMVNTTAWRLLDFGIVAEIGETAYPRCTPRYAPPEVLVAHDAEQRIVVQPSQDVWALGVMVFEAVTGTNATPGRIKAATVYDRAHGKELYPWEEPPDAQPATWRRSRLRTLTLSCLLRDASARPSADELVQSIARMTSATTWDGTD